MKICNKILTIIFCVLFVCGAFIIFKTIAHIYLPENTPLARLVGRAIVVFIIVVVLPFSTNVARRFVSKRLNK